MVAIIRGSDQERYNPLGWEFWIPLPDGFLPGHGSVIVPFPKGAKAPYHRHPNAHVLIISLSGTAMGIVNGTNISVAPGDVVLIPPNTPHKWITTSDSPWISFAIHRPPVYETDEVLDFQSVSELGNSPHWHAES
ncbi:cupin domain-containing protein [Nonomuraea rhizosphaerae]|uniref:cupin domain-containing protein n=1 Tax=Nonomuraea rhizosphaerae TaxID=2665663 RepID=UPI001C606E26|nr:cupin domain-containing protein [Nonomuraea rhizosphaerae]